jgi:hypothetical protein
MRVQGKKMRDIDLDMERDDDLQCSEEEEGKMAHGPWCVVCASDQSGVARWYVECTSTIIYILYLYKYIYIIYNSRSFLCLRILHYME